MSTLIVWLCLCSAGYAQIDSTWIKTYGGNRVDKAFDIIATADKGYMVIGTTSSFGLDNAQMYFLKLDSLGQIEWSRNYGGINQEWGHSVIQTSDGGYLGAGYTNSYGLGGYDAYFVKLAADGTYQYERAYGGSNWDFAYDVVEISPGKYAFAGETKSFGAGNSDGWVFVYDESANAFNWQTTVGDSLNDNFKSIILNFDNELVAAGGAFWNGQSHEDIIVTQFDLTGQTLSTWNYGDTLTDFANDIIQLDSSHYAATGQTYNSQFGVVISYLKMDTGGVEIFNDPWGIGFENAEGKKIMKIDSGRTAIAGFTETSGVNADYFIGYSYPNLPSYENGSSLGSLGDDFGQTAVFIDTGYVIAGYTNGFNTNFEKILIYKTNKQGKTESNNYDVLTDSVNITSVNNLNTKLDLVFTDHQIKVSDYHKIQQITIYNLSGQVVVPSFQPASTIISHQLNSGLYVISLTTSEGNHLAKKFVVR